MSGFDIAFLTDSLIEGLHETCLQSTTIYATIKSSEKTFSATVENLFQMHGSSLQTVGAQKISQVAQQIGTTAFMGIGAKAFVNVYTINNRRLLLLLAKLDDYLNACSTLKSGIDKANADLRASRNTIPHFPLINGFSIEAYSIPVPDKKVIPDDLLNGFVTHATINALLNPGSSYVAVADALQPAINQVQADIDALFAKAPPARSPNAYQRQQADAHLLVDDVGMYLESQLHIWATALLGMIAAFSAVLAEVAKLDQPTVADLIYELNTPHSPDVMFEQLASGGLLVLVKGGAPSEIEAAIQAYLSQFGYGRGTKITLMGYGKNGEATAQGSFNRRKRLLSPIPSSMR